MIVVFFFQAEDGIRDRDVTGVQTCALPICDGTSGSDFSYRQSTCVFVTSPLPPSLTANKPLREARRVRKNVHSLSFRKPSRSRSIARQVPVGCHGGGSSD